MTKRSAIIPTTAVILAGALWSAAAAAEEFTLPGQACVKGNTAGTLLYDVNIAENDSATSSAVVHCPIQRRGTDGSGIGSSLVNVVDRHPTQAVECFMRACRTDGSACIFTPTLASAGSAESQDLPFAGVAGFDNGIAFLT